MPKKKKQKVEEPVQEPVQQEEELTEEELDSMEEEFLDQLSGGGQSIIVLPPMQGAAAPEKKIRVIPVIGDVGERMALEVVAGLLTLRETGKKKVLADEDVLLLGDQVFQQHPEAEEEGCCCRRG